jgi:outer membrane protein assembly factor BamA
MSACAPIAQTLALASHKAMLGGSALGSLGCPFVHDDTAWRALDAAAAQPARMGSYDPEGPAPGAGGPPPAPPKLGYAAFDSADFDAGIAVAAPRSAVPSELPGRDIEPEAPATKAPPESAEAQLSKGGLSVSGGFSSIEGFNAQASLVRNFGGRNQELSLSASHSGLQTLVELGFADARFAGSNTLFAATVFSNSLDAAGFAGGARNAPFEQVSRGITLRFARKLGESIALVAQYKLSADTVRLDGRFAGACNPAAFGSTICGALGKRTGSIASLTASLDKRDNPAQPTRGYRLRLTQDIAGLGGSTRYARTRLSADAHIGLGRDWQLSLGAEGGAIAGAGKRGVPIFDRFYLGGTNLRGFDLRGVGPRVSSAAGTRVGDTTAGGRFYYAARAELGVPVGGVLGRNGIKPVLFADAGSAFGAKATGLLPGERLTGNSAKPRVAVGAGLAWTTPLGTMRVDAAKAVAKQTGDGTQTFSFSLLSGF